MRGLAFKHKKLIISTILLAFALVVGLTLFAISQTNQKENRVPVSSSEREVTQKPIGFVKSMAVPTREEIEASLSARDREFWEKARKEYTIYRYKDGRMVLTWVDGKQVNPDPEELYKLNIKLAEEELTPELVEKLTREVEKTGGLTAISPNY
jgi:hypothetical protein